MNDRPSFTVFTKIDTKKIEQIFETVNESIIRKPLTKQALDKITNHDLTKENVDAINDVCTTFVMAANPDKLAMEIDEAAISKDRRDTLKMCLESLKKRLSEEKIRNENNIVSLSVFGHPHIASLKIGSEFRPISTGDGEITKIISAIVLSGNLHNADDPANTTPINFQFDLKSAKKFVEYVQHVIMHVENETRVFRNKFGDDIID